MMFFKNPTTYSRSAFSILFGRKTDLMQCACVCLRPKTFMLLIYQTNFMKRITRPELNLNTEFIKVVSQINFIRRGKVWNHIFNSLLKNAWPISSLISIYYFVPVENQIRIKTAQKIFQFLIAALFLLSYRQHLNLIQYFILTMKDNHFITLSH